MNLTDVKKNIVKFCIYNIALYLPIRPQIQKSSQKFWHLTPIALVQHAYGSTLRSAGYSLPNIFKCTYIYIYIYFQESYPISLKLDVNVIVYQSIVDLR